MRTLTLFFILTFSPSLSAVGAVYKWVQADGTVVYSDSPPPHGAEEIDLPPLQRLASPPPPLPPPPQPPTFKALPYTDFRITRPGNDATLRDNNGNVDVAIKIEPALQTAFGHTLTIVLDGRALLTGLSTPAARLDNVDRGTHTLQALVVDPTGKTVGATATVTFHLHRTIMRRARP
ncbi:MAG TPA: DUF4124 domain-containing protein [Gammaproteobacteria bacterium]|nr:DUF4124 domain-containing protein [Gammaproteobacteria bacterium]